MARADQPAPFNQIKPEDGCQPGGWYFAGEDLSAAAAPPILRRGHGPGEPYCVREPMWQTFAAFFVGEPSESESFAWRKKGAGRSLGVKEERGSTEWIDAGQRTPFQENRVVAHRC